jgi:hypothetical protein
METSCFFNREELRAWLPRRAGEGRPFSITIKRKNRGIENRAFSTSELKKAREGFFQCFLLVCGRKKQG